MAEICEVVAARTMEALRAGRDAASDADIVELRLDTVDRPDVAGALQGRRRPVIVTCRAAWEGGHFKGSEEERQRILRQALDAGAELVDIEHRAIGVERWLRPEDRAARVVCSLHDFEGMPRDLADRVGDMRRTGAAIVKVAGQAHRLRDLLPLLAVGRSQRQGERTVLIGMGTAGVVSRLLAAHFGSCWAYGGSWGVGSVGAGSVGAGSWDGGPAIAPGQVPARRMLNEFHFRRISAATAVYAVVGRPIEHSISPAMHNAAFAAAGLDAVYVPCEAADFDDFCALADALPIAGASVTAPFKLSAFEIATPVDGDLNVTRLRAAHTLRRVSGPSLDRDAAWECTNTDVAGFVAPLSCRVTLRGARVAVLGAGGAARAVVAGLDAAGAQTTVYARHAAAAAELVAIAPSSTRVGQWPASIAGAWDVLVNTTPVGTFPMVDDTPFQGPFDGRLVYDLIYNPRPTRLLREAFAAGCATLDGLDMLVEQAVRQFAWWTDLAPSIEIMREAAIRRLADMTEHAPDSTRQAPGAHLERRSSLEAEV
jgi:3-dehydroquinate dehydratase/shikimate dehydrogenase